MDELAAVIARDITADSGLVLHTENGVLNMGPKAEGDAVDLDLTDADEVTVTEPGTSPPSAAPWTSPSAPRTST